MMKLGVAVGVLIVLLVQCGSPYRTRSLLQTFMCASQEECVPDEFRNSTGVPTGVPTNLVDCIFGECICQDCFMVAEVGSDVGRCTLRECREYTRNGCEDDRRSQLTALLLSIFLSGVGAANFYIDRDGLAAGQLVLFLIILFSSCAICFPLCCICCGKDSEKKGILISIYFCLITIITILASLAQTAWWIADLVIFANNDREDGDSCPLRPI